MDISRRTALTLGGAGALALAAGGGAQAQAFSDRPVTIIVPFTPGSGPDILARMLSEDIRAARNQTLIVDNKPGASGNIGAALAARAAPDGRTLVLSVNTFLMNAALHKNLQYDPVKSFDPVIELATGSLALAVHPSVPAQDAKAFIELSKQKPDELAYASPGQGTPHHMATELFKLNTGAKLRHIPYTGTAGAVTDILAGHVQAMFIPVHVGLTHANAGKLRLLGLGSAQRSPLAPNVPTLAEQGIAGVEVDLWYAVSAPAGTPRDFILGWNAAVNEILKSDKTKEALLKQGLQPTGGTPERLAAIIAADGPRWKRVVEEAGIKLE